ncbi:MAG: bifunctional DNA primase/polymerase [Beijerinckiaceae bacterium]|nr:bifunctional DNA primase/polymerase [Beijerinckiaceae bacterium]
MQMQQKYSSPFALSYQRLVANGYTPIPIRPGTKAPGMFARGQWEAMSGWNRYRDEQPVSFALKLWSSWENAGVGVVTGTRITPTHELGVVDFDTDDPSILEQMESSLPPSNVQKRGRRGYSAFYLVPIGTKGRKWKRGPQVVCELLTGNQTRQTVIPPTIHPNTGEPYRYQTAGTLETVPAVDLVELNEDDLERFLDTLAHLTLSEVEDGPSGRVAPAEPGAERPIHRQVNDLALANLDAWVPKMGLPKLKRTASGYVGVPYWRASSTGRSMDERSPNLGISRDGIRDFGTGKSYTPIDLVMEPEGWSLDRAFDWLSDALGIFADDAPSDESIARLAARSAPAPAPVAARESAIDPETGEVLDEAPSDAPPVAMLVPVSQGALEPVSAPAGPVDPDELPEALTRVPGLVGELTDWIVATARQPNRVLALGAAITAVGTLVGRRIAGPTMSGTHLYILGLAPSGAGKDHPLRQIDVVMRAANAAQLVGPEDFMSMTAIVGVLQRMPVGVCPMDEFGAFVGRLSHRRASSHETGISKILRTAWGCSFATMRTPEWGSRPSEEIIAPALSIYGLSTPDEFFKALTGDDVVNGFLNRFLLLSTNLKARPQDPQADRTEPPKWLRDKLARFYQLTHALTEEEQAAIRSNLGAPAKPKRLAADPAAQAAIALLVDEVEAARTDSELEPYFARTAEMAIRLATIRAAGRSATAVDASDVAWGRELAMWSARMMAKSAGAHMAENEFQAYGNRIVGFVTRRARPVTKREVQQFLKCALKVREVEALLEALVESGRLDSDDKLPVVLGQKRPPVTYWLPVSGGAS